MAKIKQKKPATWEDLKGGAARGSRKRAPLSWRARLRLFWLWLEWIFGIALLVGVCVGGWYLYNTTYIEELFSGKTEAVKEIEFKTDGAITGKWLNEFLKVPRGAKLADINIFALKQALESLGQVREAEIERVYPDVLRVALKEYKPFLRIAIKIDYEVKLFAISPEGKIFMPVCHSEAELDTMPFVEGYVPVFESGAPKKYQNAKRVLEFLTVCSQALPQETRRWKIVNVSQLDSLTLPLISVVREDGARLVFAPEDYKKQLDRLEYILRYAKEKPLEKIEEIDLSLKDRADVKLGEDDKKK